MSDNRAKTCKTVYSLDKPQYNSTIKFINKLDQLQQLSNKLNNEKTSIKLDEQEIERINEKASTKLNINGRIFDGLVSVEPDQEDFFKYLGKIYVFRLNT